MKPLVLDCPWPVEVGQQFQVTRRFSDGRRFFPRSFVIDDAANWCIHDLRIQHMSQLTRPDVSGDELWGALKYVQYSGMRFGDEILMIVSRQRAGDQLFRCEIQGPCYD